MSKIHRLRASVVVVSNDKILTFFAIDPHDGREFFFLPGGEIQGEETAPEAAERETLEETGYRVSVDVESAVDSDYDFYWNGKTYSATTIFYRARLSPPVQKQKTVNDEDYNKGPVWIPLEELEQKFHYSQPILEAIRSLLK